MLSGYMIHRHDHQIGRDNTKASVLTVSPGETVTMGIMDSSGGQLSINSSVPDIASLDFDKVNPVSGPV